MRQTTLTKSGAHFLDYLANNALRSYRLHIASIPKNFTISKTNESNLVVSHLDLN